MTQYQGATVEAAIQNGLKKIQISRDQVTVTVISEPVHGWFGRLKQPAIVDLTIKPIQVTNLSQSADIQEASDISSQSAGVSAVRPTTKHSVSDALRPPRPAVTKRAEELERDVDAQADVRRREGDHPHPTQTPLSPAALRERQQTNQAKVDQSMEALANYLLTLLDQMGIEAEVDAEADHRSAILTFTTQQEGLLIGRHGRTINALQVLGTTFMLRLGLQHFDLLLDVAGYRDRRANTLRRLADNTAREVIASGEPALLDPMPAFERKVIHTELAHHDYVVTSSQGREPRRAVVISPR
ncbi:RNA-binding cell elongation regulator Jag/EloR [Furfurilactobacillus curtus]|uniref:RNA-binding protein KhpB n=1 Tax=Furfurilactobacillus curtus TaxID=1746200 RepID=A0ABQ5JQV1_9LACO